MRSEAFTGSKEARGAVSPVIASGAKQSIAARKKEWIARRFAPRNDGKYRHTFAISRRVAPEVCKLISALSIRGRGECRAPDAPAASCALWVVSMHTSIHSEPSENTRHSRTQWFTAYTVLSPVIGFLATVACQRFANLMPASRHQDHTTSPSALATPVKRAAASTAPRPAFVTFAKRPSEWNRMAMDIEVIWVGGQAMLLKIRSEPKCRGAAYR
ncbi:hypothetical protein SAMN05443248_8247 [Bradyrhizobium erythrophlei]|uniref:Uncharacterized protein n=1 Tax=Bradyrhizobium erythrophlei TaxID=1437360 RepID=A0A1M5YF32_9BRAD|nr:hypothetical protein SAMN05443248_8247 [Bradyrhizobium erythrophlei]